MRGVAIILDQQCLNRNTVIQFSNRLMLPVKLSARPVDLVTVQAHMYIPTSSHEEVEIDDICTCMNK